jgi:hypothetical protein
MRITESHDRRLVIVDFPYVIALFAFPFAAALFVMALDAAVRRVGTPQTLGAFAAAVMCFLVGAALTKRSVFDFDLVEKKLTWRRRGVFTSKGGVVPFEQICDVTVDRCNNSDGDDTYGLMLHLRAGQSIEVSDIYTSNRRPIEEARAAVIDALQLANRATPPLSPGVRGSGRT